MERETGTGLVIYRTPTPVKVIINNEFGNKHEEEMMRNYEKLINDVIFILIKETKFKWEEWDYKEWSQSRQENKERWKC